MCYIKRDTAEWPKTLTTTYWSSCAVFGSEITNDFGKPQSVWAGRTSNNSIGGWKEIRIQTTKVTETNVNGKIWIWTGGWRELERNVGGGLSANSHMHSVSIINKTLGTSAVIMWRLETAIHNIYLLKSHGEINKWTRRSKI
jgi:hypothetical protein